MAILLNTWPTKCCNLRSLIYMLWRLPWVFFHDWWRTCDASVPWMADTPLGTSIINTGSGRSKRSEIKAILSLLPIAFYIHYYWAPLWNVNLKSKEQLTIVPPSFPSPLRHKGCDIMSRYSLEVRLSGPLLLERRVLPHTAAHHSALNETTCRLSFKDTGDKVKKKYWWWFNRI